MLDVSAFIRDLTILFWWILPGHAVNMRLYLLVLARLVIYTAEGVAFYSLVATVLAGTEEDRPVRSLRQDGNQGNQGKERS